MLYFYLHLFSFYLLCHTYVIHAYFINYICMCVCMDASIYIKEFNIWNYNIWISKAKLFRSVQISRKNPGMEFQYLYQIVSTRIWVIGLQYSTSSSLFIIVLWHFFIKTIITQGKKFYSIHFDGWINKKRGASDTVSFNEKGPT